MGRLTMLLTRKCPSILSQLVSLQFSHPLLLYGAVDPLIGLSEPPKVNIVHIAANHTHEVPKRIPSDSFSRKCVNVTKLYCWEHFFQYSILCCGF